VAEQLISVAIDDTDSQYGGCTTHLTGLVLSELRGKVKLADYPLLVRLNPNIPWRTRGNAATVLRLLYDGDPQDLLELAWSMALEYTQPRPPLPDKSPGVVVYVGRPWELERLRWLYRKALSDVVTFDVATKALEGGRALWRGGRGVIGAASSLAALAPGDPYTFELAFYRRPEAWGTRRCVSLPKVIELEGLSHGTLNNVELDKELTSAAPGGPDPVLAGFRGTDAEELWKFEEALCERPHFAVLYRSNQHTGVHASPLRPLVYRSVSMKVAVSSRPLKLPGGHVIVEARAADGNVYDIAFYEDSGPLARAAGLLRPGDVIEVVGGVRPYSPRGRPTVSAELMSVLSLADEFVEVAPRCPRCGSRMESAGKGKGYRCPRCGFSLPEGGRLRLPLTRELMPGHYYYRGGRARHLTPVGASLPVLRELQSVKVDDVMRTY